MGNNQGCGFPRLWTPLMYDSIGHGSHFGCHVVHKGGVANEIAMATTAAQIEYFSTPRSCMLRVNGCGKSAVRCPSISLALRNDAAKPTIQHIIPISMIEMPMVFRMSTRNRSLFGAHPHAITYSCTRNSTPSTNTSNPRQIVLRAIRLAFHPFC